MKRGSDFENEFRDSVPPDILYYRFKDGTGSWDKGEKTRFQSKNICDCELFKSPRLYFLELKSVKGSSIPKGNFRKNQIDEMTKKSAFQDVRCGFLVKFKDLGKCYYITISQFNRFWDYNTRKSIPLDYFKYNCIEVDMTLKKVNYRYNVKKLLKDIH